MRRSALIQIIETKKRFDAAETLYSARALEQVRTQTYDMKYPGLLARTLIPVDNSIDPGVDTVTYGTYSMVGAATIISNYSKKLPRADAFRQEASGKIKGVGTSYGWNVQEMRAAAFAKTPLEQRKANAARRAFEEKIDSIARIGDAQHGLIGFLNQPNASLYTIPNGASASPLWTSKTADEINNDLCGMVDSITVGTKQIETPNTLLLPLAKYTYIQGRARSAVSDTTILEFFQKNHPGIEVIGWWALAGAGASGTDRAVAYTRDPDHLQLVIPLEFTQQAPEWEGMELLTACEGRCGGVQLYYPLSMVYADGI